MSETIPTEVIAVAVAVEEPAKKVYVCKICKKPGHISSNRAFHPPTASTEDKVIDELSSLFSNLETASIDSEAETENDSESESELSETPDAENASKDVPRSEDKMASKKSACSKNSSRPEDDTYTEEVLREQYGLHRDYVSGRKASAKRLGIKFRLPSIPEDISENMIKFMIRRTGDLSSRWNCSADLLSDKEGKQECKCFTSDGPISFTPSSHWE